MSYKMALCVGCGKKLDEEVEYGFFYSSINEFLCTKCQRRFEKKLSTLKQDVLEVIVKNKDLNDMFDLFIENEEMLRKQYSKSIYWSSSKQVREYMFSLLEEVHRFAYHAGFECYLFCEMFEESDHTFFSERYFLTNSVIKVIGAWEKLFLYYSLFFGTDLDVNSKNNSLISMRKKLNKTDFIKTAIYKDFTRLKSNGSFNKVDDARKYNDHNVSYHLGNNYSETLEVAQAVLENVKVLYCGIEEAIQLLNKRVRLVKKEFTNKHHLVTKPEENYKVFKKKAKKIQKEYSHHKVKAINELSVDYIIWSENRLAEASSWKIRFSNPPLLSIYYRLIDVSVRLHESARSLGYAVEMFRDAVKFNYVDLDKYWIKFDGMNYRYFIHSALIRIYASYDKIAVIIQELFEIDFKNASLEKTINIMKTNDDFSFYNSLPPFKIISRILSDSSYKRLYNSRQDFFHLLVMQDFMNPRYKEILDAELMIAIIDNSKMIYELIESIDIALVNFHRLGAFHAMNQDEK